MNSQCVEHKDKAAERRGQVFYSAASGVHTLGTNRLRMDETEKYQQRLQAIAEKRRLQEEEEKAKREMESERLRLQQLKRKSLRDQWLMDGPTSPGPRSPGWGSKTQDIEHHIDQLQTESHRLAEKEVKLEQQMEVGQADAAVVLTATADKVHAAILENGQRVEEIEPVLEIFKTPLLEETEIPTDKIEHGEGKTTTHNASEGGRLPNDPEVVATGDGAVTMTFLGLEEAGPYKNPMTDDEGGVIVTRAERVIITDKGEELAPLEGSGKTSHRSESPVEVPEESADVEKEAEAKVAFSSAGIVTETITEEEPDTEGKASDQPAESAAKSEVGEEQGTSMAPKTVALREEQFHEVSLAEAQTEAVENEPLLVPTKAQALTRPDPVAPEPHAPTRGEAEGGLGVSPKRKTCQCCSVM
ncbi:hypothetical protein DPEC_G00172510 [Dallia pectoralis]|uniref:Uncharacterized protein n=1 Tax=Dallia pectoralis TaxID=75939 RepID=A0ACC2GE02_DALPE|nr:hypothetical protein DPEC_G00172510 [Dallia pectoralis]